MRRKGETYKVEHYGVTFTVERQAHAIYRDLTAAEKKAAGWDVSTGGASPGILVDYEPMPERSADPSLAKWGKSLKGLVTEAGVRISFNDKGQAFAMTSIEAQGASIRAYTGDSFTVNISGKTFSCERVVRVGESIAPTLRKAKRTLAKAEQAAKKWEDAGLLINMEDY